MRVDLDDKTNLLAYNKRLLKEALKEKEDLSAKLAKWKESSKNLNKLLNSQMSAGDMNGLGYGDHRYDRVLNYENEMFHSVFKATSNDSERSLYDRFVK